MSEPVTRRSFGSDWNAVVAHWAQGGPVNTNAEEGWAALGALERLRPGYLADCYERQALGNAEFAQLLAHGSDLLACEHLPGLDRVLGRLEHGERGAMVELGVAAFFARSGFIPVIQPQQTGKVLDLGLDVAHRRVFVEVIGPTWSDAAARLRDQLKGAAETLFAHLGPNQRLQVGFLVEPTDVVVDRVDAAMSRLVTSGSVVPIENVALARLDPFDHEAPGIDLGPSPAIGYARLELDPRGSRIVNAVATFSDERAQRLLAAELHHFARDQPNLLAIDVGAVVGGLAGWVPLIKRCFQPARNTRLGAVLILERQYEGVVVPGAWRGQVLRNPHAATPVPTPLLGIQEQSTAPWETRKRALWAMSARERIDAMRAGRLSLRECLHWPASASRRAAAQRRVRVPRHHHPRDRRRFDRKPHHTAEAAAAHVIARR